MGTTLYIKTMVCVRCRMAVQLVLDENSIAWKSIDLGKAELETEISDDEKINISKGLAHFELEIIEQKKPLLVHRIKTEIIKMITAPDPSQLKLSVHLSEAFHYNYTYLSNIFSEEEGVSPERFLITQRIEKVKEMIIYEEHSVTEIAEILHYSSVAHLCQQFKKVTGMTPAFFRKNFSLSDGKYRTA